MVLNGEEGIECEVHVDGINLEHVWEFKYLGCCNWKSIIFKDSKNKLNYPIKCNII